MSTIEIVSLASLLILFVIMCFVVKNNLIFILIGRQRAVAERDGTMVDVQNRATQTADTPLQPRVGEMATIAMHVIPHQRRVLESGGSEIRTAIGRQRMPVQPNTCVHQRITNRPLPRENDE